MQHQGVQQQGHKSEGPDPSDVEVAVMHDGKSLVARLVRHHGYTMITQWASDAQYKIGQEQEAQRQSEREEKIRRLEETVKAGQQARAELEKMSK